MGQWLRDRLRSEADRRRMTVSELARVLIRDGLDNQYEQQNPWTHKAVEELLISIFGIETLVVETYMEPTKNPKPGKEARVKIIKEADDDARQFTKKVLETN